MGLLHGGMSLVIIACKLGLGLEGHRLLTRPTCGPGEESNAPTQLVAPTAYWITTGHKNVPKLGHNKTTFFPLTESVIPGWGPMDLIINFLVTLSRTQHILWKKTVKVDANIWLNTSILLTQVLFRPNCPTTGLFLAGQMRGHMYAT